MAGEWMDRHRKAVAANRAQNGGKARDNRPVRWGDDGVGGYARDMKAGKWRLNGETIKIARDGTVPDGQHRLLAGIEAGVPFWSLVVTGVEPEAQDTIDIGIGRKLADSLSIAGKPNHIALASIARWSLRWLHGHRGGTTGGGTYKPTQREVLEYIAQAPHLELAAKFAVHARKEFRPVRASTWGMAWLLLNGTDALAATVFFERIFDGADLPRKSPVLVFRTRLTNAALNKERLTEQEQHVPDRLWAADAPPASSSGSRTASGSSPGCSRPSPRSTCTGRRSGPRCGRSAPGRRAAATTRRPSRTRGTGGCTRTRTGSRSAAYGRSTGPGSATTRRWNAAPARYGGQLGGRSPAAWPSPGPSRTPSTGW